MKDFRDDGEKWHRYLPGTSWDRGRPARSRTIAGGTPAVPGQTCFFPVTGQNAVFLWARVQMVRTLNTGSRPTLPVRSSGLILSRALHILRHEKPIAREQDEPGDDKKHGKRCERRVESPGLFE